MPATLRRTLWLPSSNLHSSAPRQHRGDAMPHAAAAAARPRQRPPMIEFRGVSKRYGGGDIGLDQATFSIDQRRLRVPGRLDRIREVDRHAAADQGARPDRAARSASPATTLDEITRKRDPVLPPQHRRRLPGLQAAAEPHRVRERRLRAAGHGRRAQGDPRQGAGHPAADRAVDQAPQLPRSAVRRRAAARLDRARVRQPPAAAAGRRADREPRPGDQHRHHAAALPDQPHRARPCSSPPTTRRWSTRCAAGCSSCPRGRIVRDEAAGLYARDESTREFARRLRAPATRPPGV